MAWRMLGCRPRRVHVVAGHGNNGGDALVAARHLSAWGCAVTATVHGAPTRVTGCTERHVARRSGPASPRSSRRTRGRRRLRAAGAALLVDGLLGTGLRGRAATRPCRCHRAHARHHPQHRRPQRRSTPTTARAAGRRCAPARPARSPRANGASGWPECASVDGECTLPTSACRARRGCAAGWSRRAAFAAGRSDCVPAPRALSGSHPPALSELRLACMLARSACPLARQRHDQRRSRHRTRCE